MSKFKVHFQVIIDEEKNIQRVALTDFWPFFTELLLIN